MASRFNLYMTEINEQTAWVEVEMRFSDKAANTNYPEVYNVNIAIREADRDGLPKVNELVILEAYEYTIINALEQDGHSLCAGRVTMGGVRQLFFYTNPLSVDPGKKIADMWGDTPAFETRITGRESDPDWAYYFDFLLPSNEERMQMLSRQRIEQLKTEGDTLLSPRPIVHTVTFHTSKQSEAFRDSMTKLRFSIEDHYVDEKTGDYVVEICRDDRPDYDTIGDVTASLTELAQSFEGTYRGWQTIAIFA